MRFMLKFFLSHWKITFFLIKHIYIVLNMFRYLYRFKYNNA